MNFKDALKYGFFEMQNARDRYRDITADIGMHAHLVKYWIRTACLLVTPVAPQHPPQSHHPLVLAHELP